MRHFFAKFLDPVFDTRKLHGSTGVVGCLHHAEIAREVEGLVHISTLIDDYYHYDDNMKALIGEHTANIYRMGQKVRVKCVGANRFKREIDFEILTKKNKKKKNDIKELPKQRIRKKNRA